MRGLGNANLACRYVLPKGLPIHSSLEKPWKILSLRRGTGAETYWGHPETSCQASESISSLFLAILFPWGCFINTVAKCREARYRTTAASIHSMSRTRRFTVLCLTLPWLWQTVGTCPKGLLRKSSRSIKKNWMAWNPGSPELKRSKSDRKHTAASGWKNVLLLATFGLGLRVRKSRQENSAPCHS